MTGRERRRTIDGQFAPRTIEMLESPSYRVLSLSARRVLDRLEIELGHHGGTGNGDLPVTYDQFQEFGLGRLSSYRAASLHAGRPFSWAIN